jgi:hypothetical protein
MIRKYTSLLLAAVLLLHLAGFYVYFVVRLGDIRADMRNQLASLPTHQLQIVSVPLAEFKSSWMEEKEMRWQGRMYDIARVKQSGDRLLVYCLRDHDEDDLISFLNTVVDLSNKDTRQVPSFVFKLFALKYIAGHPVNVAVSVDPGISPTPYVSARLVSIAHLPATPPPRA